MRNWNQPESWVVYRMTMVNSEEVRNATCPQSEWEAMERAHPGVHTLVRSGILSEGEAERLARGTSGDPPLRGAKRKKEPVAIPLPTALTPA
jgi:hypothetical protein